MQYNPRETRRVLANCTDVIGRVHKELLQEQSCISKLAGQEHERRRAVEALLREAAHGLPVFTIRCEYDAGSKVHSKRIVVCQSHRCQIKVEKEEDPQFPDHSEDRTIRIGRLAHESVGSFDAADDDDVETEDLDVHDITCLVRVNRQGCASDDTLRSHYVRHASNKCD
jgi:hypothetical protein